VSSLRSALPGESWRTLLQTFRTKVFLQHCRKRPGRARQRADRPGDRAQGDVSEIMVNSGGRVFLERDGAVLEAEGVILAERSLQVAVRNIARTLGDDVSGATTGWS
jgi:hypothetical protein